MIKSGHYRVSSYESILAAINFEQSDRQMDGLAFLCTLSFRVPKWKVSLPSPSLNLTQSKAQSLTHGVRALGQQQKKERWQWTGVEMGHEFRE